MIQGMNEHVWGRTRAITASTGSNTRKITVVVFWGETREEEVEVVYKNPGWLVSWRLVLAASTFADLLC